MSKDPSKADRVERLEMRAHIDGLVRLLANNLYPESDAFVRELVQNGHDGILRRQREQPDLTGRIDIQIKRANRTITFRDNGIGMDRADIQDFLSVVGASGTGVTRLALEGGGEGEVGQSLIGQFGIGALAAFLVADRVSVHTRRHGSSEGWLWENSGSVECSLKPLSRDEPGTTVTVHVGVAHARVLDSSWVRRAIVRYCDLLPVPVYIDGGGPVNAIDAPWHATDWLDPAAKATAYRDFAARHLKGAPLAILPVDIDKPVRARGLVHIGDHRIPDVSAAGLVDIYVRRMFVKARDPELLPPWARFARAIIDSPDLSPTAARDNVRRDEKSWVALKNALAGHLVDWMRRLALEEPETFARVCSAHRFHLSMMAASNLEFFDAVGDRLPFETNHGPLPLADCISDGESGTLYYFPVDADARHDAALAAARGIVVVRASHAGEESLLLRYVQAHEGELRLVRLGSSHDSLLWRAATQSPERVRRLERRAFLALRRAGLPIKEVSIRRFEPASRPSLLVVSKDSAAELRLAELVQQSWLADALKELAKDVLDEGRHGLSLVLNENHELVRRLLTDTPGTSARDEVFCGLFLGACLHAPEVPISQVADALLPPLASVLSRALESADATRAAPASSDGAFGLSAANAPTSDATAVVALAEAAYDPVA